MTDGNIPVDEAIVAKPQSMSSQVREKYRNQCAGCGGDDHLMVKQVVPLEAGGNDSLDNHILICRPCSLAITATPSGVGKRRLVNFWTSAELYKWMNGSSGFDGMGSLVRFLMGWYLEDPSRFDDLNLYQDEEAATRVNVWVDAGAYKEFKAALDQQGVTVTAAFRALLSMYRAQGEKEGV